VSVLARKSFTLAQPLPATLQLRLLIDDGCVVYLNGTEVGRLRGPVNTLANTAASSSRSLANGTYETLTLSNLSSLLLEGTNVLAIHAANASISNSDFYLDAELSFAGGPSRIGPTPLAANSNQTPQSPPAISKVDAVSLAPLPAEWPTPGVPVRVTARVTDPQGVASVALAYQVVTPGDYIERADPRYDAPASWTNVAMQDDGLGADLGKNDGLWSATIPGQSHRQLVRYRLTAVDTLNQQTRAPVASDPCPNFAYYVYGALPAWSGAIQPGASGDRGASQSFAPATLASVPIHHLITTRTDHEDSQLIPNSTRPRPTFPWPASEDVYAYQGTLCYDGRVYDHIRYRTRGGVSRYNMGKNMWKFDFNRGHDFQARDHQGQKYDQPWKKLNYSSCIQQGDWGTRGEHGLYEAAGFKFFDLAGVPSMKTNWVHFRIVENAQETGPTNSQYDDDFQGLYLAVEQPDGQFLDEQKLPDGNLYKMENGTGELNNQGPTQPTDKSDLNAFIGASGYGGPNGSSESWWRSQADISSYTSYRVILDALHHYDTGGGRNYLFYNNPMTQRWQVLPWDLDLTWHDGSYLPDTGIAGLPPVNNPTEPWFPLLYGNGATTGIPAIRQEMRNRYRELIDLLWNPEQGGLVIDTLAKHIYQPGLLSLTEADRRMWDYNPILISSYVTAVDAGHGLYYSAAKDDPATPAQEAGAFSGMLVRMKDYIRRRGEVFQSTILTDEPQIPQRPTIALAGPANHPVSDLRFTASAFASPSGRSYAATQWRIAEITDPAAPGYTPWSPQNDPLYEIQASWTSAELPSAAEIRIPPTAVRVGRLHRVRVRHKDAAGAWSHWSQPYQFTAGPADLLAYTSSLVVSAIMYNPLAPTLPHERAASVLADDYEWIEVANVGPDPLDMTSVRFTKGIDFDFAGSAITTLAPGARAVVVRHLAAFQARYGLGLPVAGVWQAGNNLSNGGERVKLSFGAGESIRDFNYDDTAPWPTTPDTQGHALVLRSPSTLPDHALAANWQASLTAGGAPGVSGLTYAAWANSHGSLLPQADDDGDGLSNLIEYGLGRQPLSPEVDDIAFQATLSAGEWLLSIIVDSLAEQAEWEPLASDNLDTWTSTGFTLLSSEPLPDNKVRLTWAHPETMPDMGAPTNPRLFFKIEARLR
jgi:hypothetical protein